MTLGAPGERAVGLRRPKDRMRVRFAAEKEPNRLHPRKAPQATIPVLVVVMMVMVMVVVMVVVMVIVVMVMVVIVIVIVVMVMVMVMIIFSNHHRLFFGNGRIDGAFVLGSQNVLCVWDRI
jgi:uncharacterized membrane protein